MLKNNRIEYISLASVISTIAVIYLHTNGIFWSFSTERYWLTANIIECVFYFAVPIFFMISGAMLIDFNKKYDLKTYFSKRITKTVIPFIVWSFIALLLQLYIFKFLMEPSVVINLEYIANQLLKGELFGTYWFFIPLFGCYLTIPIFSLIQDDKKKNCFIYITTIMFILNFLIPFINGLLSMPIEYPIGIEHRKGGQTFTLFGGYIFYVLVGYLLHKYEMSKNWKITLYLLSIIGLLMHIIGTYVFSMSIGFIDETFKGYLNVPCILYSIGIFVFIKYDLIKIMKLNPIKKVVNYLDSYTLGIYLIHFFVLAFLGNILRIDMNPLISRLFMPIIILIITVAIIWLIRKIPILKRIVP